MNTMSPPRGTVTGVETHSDMHTPDRDAERALASAVAPGGALLVVHHADVDVETGKAHGFDPEDYVQHDGVLAVLDTGWCVEVDEVRPRDDVGGAGGHHKDDLVLLAGGCRTARDCTGTFERKARVTAVSRPVLP